MIILNVFEILGFIFYVEEFFVFILFNIIDCEESFKKDRF